MFSKSKNYKKKATMFRAERHFKAVRLGPGSAACVGGSAWPAVPPRMLERGHIRVIHFSGFCFCSF